MQGALSEMFGEFSEAVMSNLSLARIMFGGSEDVRRYAGRGLPASAGSLAPFVSLHSVAVQEAPTYLLHGGILRRLWLRLSAKS